MAEKKMVWCVDCQYCPHDDPHGVCWFGERYFGSHLNLCGHFLDANLVRVVRCKDCHWRTGIEEHTAWHPCDEVPVNDDWFCAYGERRVDNV